MELTELEAAGLNASLYGPPADRVWLYVHGKGGCKEEAADFAALALSLIHICHCLNKGGDAFVDGQHVMGTGTGACAGQSPQDIL